MTPNKVVAHYHDGRTLKGFVADFFPNKEVFHLVPSDTPKAAAVTVRFNELKALFFVKDFKGNSPYHDRKEFKSDRAVIGRKIQVIFKDGEILLGTTQGFHSDRPGFFLIPADPRSNNERCFVFVAATRKIAFV